MASFSSNAAPSDNDAPTRTVKVWDLDLGKATDVQALYERLQAAANEMCLTEAKRHWVVTRQRAPVGWTQRCATDAVDAAVRTTASQRLATLHAGARTARLARSGGF